MENNTSSKTEDLFATANQYIKGGFPNPEDYGKPHINWHWASGQFFGEAYEKARQSLIGSLLPASYDTINQGLRMLNFLTEPQPNPWRNDSFKLTMARSFAQVVIGNAQTMQYTGENAGRNTDYIGGIQLISDVIDDICPPYNKRGPHHHFDSIDLFVIAAEFKAATGTISHEGLRQSLAKNAEKLAEAALKQISA
ncbi:hypothetical protein [Chitinophaga sp. Cy-1792]|uniref:hypothetical protein n=1 Tax=Chitinophaga sp. Cy-1792 TaxID=2608339 RepID=UPI001421CC03|nr:hypothetical protein [Chitinophaga sp. Cy-1792]NIG55448.1 hypothetical protein [Chitinophaga sp. Cy-1792]